MVQNNKQKSFCPPGIQKSRGLQGQHLTGTIVDVMDSCIQLRQVPERITNISCAKICMIRNLTLEEAKSLKVDLPPLLDFWNVIL